MPWYIKSHRVSNWIQSVGTWGTADGNNALTIEEAEDYTAPRNPGGLILIPKSSLMMPAVMLVFEIQTSWTEQLHYLYTTGKLIVWGCHHHNHCTFRVVLLLPLWYTKARKTDVQAHLFPLNKYLFYIFKFSACKLYTYFLKLRQ